MRRVKHDNVNMEELLFGYSSRLRYVVRFCTCHRVRDENVAEHSYYTALYAMVLGRELRLNSDEMSELLQRCLIHDLEEAESGDFPRPFKYSTAALKRSLDKAAVIAFNRVVGQLVDAGEAKELREKWQYAKTGSLGRIVEFCDFLSVIAYLCQEVRAGNQTMYRHCRDLQEYYDKFLADEYEFLAPWIERVGEIMRRELKDAQA